MFNVFGSNQYKKEEKKEMISLSDNSFFIDRNTKDVKEKKRILLLVDTYDWSFHNIAKRVQKEFTNYDIDILSTVDFYKNTKEILKNPYNIYCFLYPSQLFSINEINYIKNVGKYKYGEKSKIFWCMYDNYSWRYMTKGANRRMIDNRNRMAHWMMFGDGYFWASPKIRDNIYEMFKIIKPCASCMDGVESGIFNYKEYDDDILTKEKLKIGWIGNSDIKMSGYQKGFTEIKQYVTDLSANFDFYPLDKQIKQIPHNEVPNYIHNIDIIVCYSTCEGTPNQILEGSSCGRCWVSTDVGIVSSVYNTIEDNPTGIIIKKNEKAFKDALMKLYNNRELIVEYGRNGRKAIEVKWDWKYRLEGFERMFAQA
jgi:glycosyltransferase involved in cell wall biosynthesis